MLFMGSPLLQRNGRKWENDVYVMHYGEKSIYVWKIYWKTCDVSLKCLYSVHSYHVESATHYSVLFTMWVLCKYKWKELQNT